VVEHVVHAADELVDLLAVEGGEERPVELLDRLARQVVAGVLGVVDLLRLVLEVGVVAQEGVDETGALLEVVGGALEEVEEPLVLRQQSDHAAPSPRSRRAAGDGALARRISSTGGETVGERSAAFKGRRRSRSRARTRRARARDRTTPAPRRVARRGAASRSSRARARP